MSLVNFSIFKLAKKTKKNYFKALLFTSLSSLFISPAIASKIDANARYIVSLGGVNIATVKINLKDDGKNFNLSLGAKISGIGALVSSGTASASTKGISNSNSLLPKSMNISTKAKNTNFSVNVQYSGKNASGFQVDPPLINNIGRVPIERKHLLGVSDPIGSFIIKGKKLDSKLCKSNLKIFTGLERFNIKMKYVKTQTATSNKTGYQGPVILCTMDYQPVSGHFKTSGMSSYLANSKRMLIWYAPLKESDYFIPYRVIIGTSAGDLSMVLTSLR